MAVTVKHSTPADGTFSATGAAAWDADHNFTGTIDVTNGGTGANTLTANALLKGNGTSAISASSITDNGTLVTVAEPVRLSTPNTSSAAWTTSGINLIQSAATFTDTSSTGTVGSVRMNNFAAQTLAASNTLTVSNLYGTYFVNPVGGTNVTASGVFGLGADSARITQTLIVDGTLSLGGLPTTTTAQFATATTSSGNTKTVNIGTNGASGSTTNITVGSATSGATSSITANGQVTLAPIGGSRAAWTTNGVGLIQSAATWTDTTSTGTVGQVNVNNFAPQTVAASNALTISTLFGTYFTNPVAGTNVTAQGRYAIGCDAIAVLGTLQASSTLSLSGPTSTTTAQFATATTSSGNTKTVNIGTGGASGSTTAITLGSSTSGATSTTLLNGNVGVGSTNSTVNFQNSRNITGATSAYANYTNGTIQSDVTSQGYGYATVLSTAATTFTLSNLFHYRAQQGSFGAGSTVNNQYGFFGSAQNIDGNVNNAFYADDTAAVTTGKTAYGFRSAINIATGGGTTYQMFMGGTAPSVVRGTVTFGGLNFSQAAWTTNGVGLIQAATTYTDTTSTGTVANVYMNSFGAQTLAATNTITATNLYGTYFAAPVAGTNVTATNRYALGTDSFFVNALLQTAGTTVLSRASGNITAAIADGVTSTGNTKTVNIGTGGASGSTTAITLGSSTSGATQTTTINGRVTLAPIGASAAAWTTSGIALTQSNATFTDTSSTGTVAVSVLNRFNQLSMAASNPITVTHLYGTYFQNAASGTNVTATNAWAVAVENFRCLGNAQFTSGNTLTALGTISLTGETTTTTASFATGVTASGSTKTVNIGTGGASGSTTNITIGSSTSGATSTITLNGKTTFAGTAQLQGYTVATLPAGTQGMTAFVTDALAPAWNTTLVGGGAVVCKAFFNGTAWVAG